MTESEVGLDPQPVHPAPLQSAGGHEVDAVLQSVNASLSAVATVMEYLTGQLVDLSQLFAQTKTIRATEEEIGWLFTQAQAYVERSRAEARHEADAILDEARREAADIVDSARRQAASLPADLASRLASTIEVFHKANTALQHELVELRSTFTRDTAGQVAAPPPRSTVVTELPPPPSAPLPIQSASQHSDPAPAGQPNRSHESPVPERSSVGRLAG
jgi:hypothetical protein